VDWELSWYWFFGHNGFWYLMLKIISLLLWHFGVRCFGWRWCFVIMILWKFIVYISSDDSYPCFLKLKLLTWKLTWLCGVYPMQRVALDVLLCEGGTTSDVFPQQFVDWGRYAMEVSKIVESSGSGLLHLWIVLVQSVVIGCDEVYKTTELFQTFTIGIWGRYVMVVTSYEIPIDQVWR